MLHGIIGSLYRFTSFWPWLQEKIALWGDSILTRIEHHDR